jgi:hypothetical protein
LKLLQNSAISGSKVSSVFPSRPVARNDRRQKIYISSRQRRLTCDEINFRWFGILV